jgi:hypothetical protein
MGLLEQIQKICGCFYLSDLHYFPYNVIAKALFNSMDLKKYNLKDISDAYNYIFTKKNKGRYN